MTLIDSVDSIIMLYSYSGFPDRSFKLFEGRTEDTKPLVRSADRDDISEPPSPVSPESPISPVSPSAPLRPRAQREDSMDPSKTPSPLASVAELPARPPSNSGSGTPAVTDSASLKAKAAIFDEENLATTEVDVQPVENEEAKRLRRVKLNAMSGLSIMLTLMSILVAFRYVCPITPSRSRLHDTG